MAKIDQILVKSAQVGASDVHIAANNPPMFLYLCREQGDIILNKDYIAFVRE